MKYKFPIAILLFAVALPVTSCGGSSTSTISATVISLNMGEKHQVSFVHNRAIYESSDKTVASVNNKGVIIARKEGEAVIKAYLKENGKKELKETVKVTVTRTLPIKYDYYDVKDEVEDLSFVEGYPWMNTQIEGVLSNISKPSIKDDYWAATNYDLLKDVVVPEGEKEAGGFVNESNELVKERLTAIRQKETFSTILNAINQGSISSVRAEVNSILNFSHEELVAYLNSGVLFEGQSRLLDIIHYKRNSEILLTYSNFYDLPNLFYCVWYGFYYNRRDKVLSAMNEIAKAEGFDLSTISSVIEDGADKLYSILDKLPDDYYLSNNTTVGALANLNSGSVNLKNILNNYGLEDNRQISYLNAVIEIPQMLCNMSDTSIKNILALAKMVDGRYFIGASNYLELSNKIYQDFYISKPEQEFPEDTTVESVAKYILNVFFRDMINRQYIEDYVTPESRTLFYDLIEEIIAAYRTVFANEDWLSEQTKSKAIEKLNAMDYTVFYYDSYLDCQPFTYGDQTDLVSIYNSYNDYYLQRVAVGNIYSNTLFDYSTYFSNAAYYAGDNSFMIYEGLICSIMDDELTREDLYGKIGFVIGHEISHGFDDTGSQFDKYGNYNSWWTSEDRSRFNQKVRTLKSYMEKETRSLDDYAYNGDFVSGEVIADMGGARVCLEAAKKYTSFDYDTMFKGVSSFFGWIIPKEYIIDQVRTNAHPIGYLRVNLSLAQFQEFIDKYDLKEGDGMYLPSENRIAIW